MRLMAERRLLHCWPTLAKWNENTPLHLRTNSGIRRGGRKRRSPHGFMTSEIKRMLAYAGDQGVSVQSVVTSLDKPSSNVSVWFSNAKKAGLVESIRRGVYRLKNAPVVVATTTIS